MQRYRVINPYDTAATIDTGLVIEFTASGPCVSAPRRRCVVEQGAWELKGRQRHTWPVALTFYSVLMGDSVIAIKNAFALDVIAPID